MDVIAVSVIVGAISTAGGVAGFFVHQYFQQLKTINKKISDREIIELAKQNNGILTPAILCEHTNLSLSEAKTKLENLAMNGTIGRKYDWSDWSGNKYTLAGYETQANLTSFLNSFFTPPKPLTTPLLNKKEPLTDAMVIKYALETQGKISVPALCLKANCSVDEAKVKLEELQKKEIFDLRVSDNGTYIYELTDMNLLK
jgi:hypothetical protein